MARLSGIPASTLRYYDSIGLIEPGRAINGYRDYDESVLERLAFVEAAKHLDLSLAEIVDLLAVVQGDSCTRVRDSLSPRLGARLREVDQRIEALTLLRRRLFAASRRVAACPDSEDSCRSECMLLGEQRRVCAADLHSQPAGAVARHG